MERARYLCCLGLMIAAAITPVAAGQGEPSESLLNMDLEDLMQVEVTTASRLGESKREAPAAITVLTQEDIQRSGATSLPEVLRLVPGLYVARLNANKWSVTARGFGGRFANKMQVLVDGQSIYSPLFSGTFWEVEEVVLEDVDRIEVLRGPGGATWGANAVNGIINIVTKSARDTDSFVRVGGGSEDPARLGLRYTEHFSEDLAMRVSGQYLHRGQMDSPTGGAAHDDYDLTNLQLRLDWAPPGPDELTFIAKGLTSRVHDSLLLAQPLPPWQVNSRDISTYDQLNAQIRWRHERTNGGDFQLQAYADHWHDDSIVIDDRRQIADIEAQWRTDPDARVEWAYGLGMRYVRDTIDSRYATFDPEREDALTYDVFASMGAWAVPEKLRVMLGARVHWNDYTGVEVEPTARVTWLPAEKHSVWAAVSRGVRVPSRSERDLLLPNFGFTGVMIPLDGSKDLESEVLLSYELGYRFMPKPDFAIEVATYVNHYDKLRTVELDYPRVDFWEGWPALLIPFEARNNMEATVMGGSVALDWRPREWWRVRGSWAYLNEHLNPQFRSLDIITEQTSRDTPRHVFTLWNSFDITPKVSLDSLLQYVDRLDGLDVDDYVIANLRLGWRPREDLLLSLVGTNLLDSSHLEYTSSLVNTEVAEIERGIYAEVKWTF